MFWSNVGKGRWAGGRRRTTKVTSLGCSDALTVRFFGELVWSVILGFWSRVPYRDRFTVKVKGSVASGIPVAVVGFEG